MTPVPLHAPYAYPWHLRTTINGLAVWDRRDNENALLADIREMKFQMGPSAEWQHLWTWQVFHHHFTGVEMVEEEESLELAMERVDAFLKAKGYKFIPLKFAALI